ncbi:ribulose-phosphate 3-epimerase [Alkalihalobacillus oceani]|uniref:ribulose-phosphate 3-epimerase n=1 Tax=Halalkalibacter oceani TaxID=1653776 RepID=UPI00203AADD5|nr:ribulose-phosphate 3-epimerase [Halalkalibacter oceani]MCM3760018.1 ribulose-phosphate 3-epimerase [Halalkalibacter oceani]
MINAPSIANCDLLHIGKQIDELVAGGVTFLHIDLMDGHYVPNLFLPTSVVKAIKMKYPHIVTDVHLMVSNPEAYVDLLKEYDADYVSFHIDSTSFSIRILRDIREKGMKAGVVINPSQRIDCIEPLIRYVDYVVLMTVEPGFAGQTFMEGSLERLDELQQLRQKYKASFLISVDGGIDYPNAIESVKRGADILITGIYTIFNQSVGLTEACKKFQQDMHNVEISRKCLHD